MASGCVWGGQFTVQRAGPLEFSAPGWGEETGTISARVTRVRFRVAELFNPLPMQVSGSAQVSQVCLCVFARS